ncbi:hypothetical protein J2T56_001772 [Natronobacillus azotifigens]|uniref:Sigma factor G inhibitor Gin n=1 Tax=Natronobacillus azotifigens TaxID=472978 RepID=A0A9J6RE29_9BACI|nr:sigma factor G inhibitor Gin [Natronobacillus azotifigens]MCZ0703630.1 sigma factor G inhibitor Gin [Natronobacillus azotifigens]
MSTNYCKICESEQEKGIHLYHLFICEACEAKMIQTVPEDPDYAYFVEKLKKINTKPLQI